MKKRILAILLAIALLSSVAGVVAYAAEVYTTTSESSTTKDGVTTYSVTVLYNNDKKCEKCNSFLVSAKEATGTSTSSSTDALNKAKSAAKAAWDSAYAEHFNNCCKCATCGMAFDSLSAYNSHVSTAHPVAHYYCPYKCDYNINSNDGKLYFATAEELEAHIASNHVENPNALHCPYKDKDGVKCTYIAYSISDYNNHIAANHQKDGEQVTPRDNIQRFFDKYFMGIGLNVNENSFSSVVRIFAYVTEVFMSVFTDSGASEVFQFAGDSGVTYFFETIVPHFWALFTE